MTESDTVVKCLAIGDPHFKVSNVPDCEELIRKVLALIDETGPTFVVLLGDTLDTHEKIHVVPFGLATRFIMAIAKKCPVYLLIGNHDYCNNQQFLTDAHAFNSFKKIAGVTVVDRPIARAVGEKKFVFCPYVPPNRFEEALGVLEAKGQAWRDAQCIFAHQEFYGCSYNPIMTSTEGDIWPEEYPLVVSGHIHNEQRLQTNIYYPGASLQHAFGETGHKTIALLTFKPDGKFRIKKIDLGLRQKKIVRLSIADAAGYTPPENTLIKLVIRGTAEDIKVFRKSASFRALHSKGIAVSFAPSEEGQEITDEQRRVVANKKNVLDILSEIVKTENEYVKEAFERLKKN